jgi:hypothetical protein
MFSHFYSRKKKLENDIEFHNSKCFYEQNMKAVVADTCDYIQVLYNKNYTYLIEGHEFE